MESIQSITYFIQIKSLRIVLNCVETFNHVVYDDSASDETINIFGFFLLHSTTIKL